MGYRNHGAFILLEMLFQPLHRFRIQMIRRFIQQQNIRFLNQQPTERHSSERQVVEEGRADVVQLLRDYEEISQRFGEDMSPEDMEALIERQGKLQEQIEAVNGWELEHQLDVAMDALRCPPRDAIVDDLSGG